MKTLYAFNIMSRLIHLILRNCLNKCCAENHNALFIFKNFFRKSCRLWNNVEKYCRALRVRDDNIIRRVLITCWVTNAINTHSQYVMFSAFPLQQFYRSRLNVTLHVHSLSCSYDLYIWSSSSSTSSSPFVAISAAIDLLHPRVIVFKGLPNSFSPFYLRLQY